MPKPKPQLHVSHLIAMTMCGIRFQRTSGYIFDVWPKKEIQPPGIALLTGIAVHDGVEHNMLTKIDTGKLAPRQEIADKTADRFKTEFAGDIMLTEDEGLNVNRTKDAALDMSIRLAMLHYNECAPIIKPTEVEWKWVLEFDNYPYNMGGRADIVAGEDLIDTKTAKMRPDVYAAKTLQFKTYCMARKIHTKKRPKKTHADYLIKTKVPKYLRVTDNPVASWDNDVMVRFEAATALIQAVKEGHNAFCPAPPDAWWCSKRFCGFAANGSCKFWSGRK